MMKLLLAFVLAGFLLLCGAYSILAYYRLVSIAKGIGPHSWIRSQTSSNSTTTMEETFKKSF